MCRLLLRPGAILLLLFRRRRALGRLLGRRGSVLGYLDRCCRRGRSIPLVLGGVVVGVGLVVLRRSWGSLGSVLIVVEAGRMGCIDLRMLLWVVVRSMPGPGAVIVDGLVGLDRSDHRSHLGSMVDCSLVSQVDCPSMGSNLVATFCCGM